MTTSKEVVEKILSITTVKTEIIFKEMFLVVEKLYRDEFLSKDEYKICMGHILKNIVSLNK